MGNRAIKHWMYDHYLWIVGDLLAIGVSGYFLASKQSHDSTKIFLAYMGAVLAFFYFIHKQGAEDLRLFNDLFRECNHRTTGSMRNSIGSGKGYKLKNLLRCGCGPSQRL